MGYDWSKHELREAFWTPYEEMQTHIGKKFKIINQVPDDELDAELQGEQFNIELEDGVKITAWAEEIYKNSCVVGGQRV